MSITNFLYPSHNAWPQTKQQLATMEHPGSTVKEDKNVGGTEEDKGGRQQLHRRKGCHSTHICS